MREAGRGYLVVAAHLLVTIGAEAGEECHLLLSDCVVARAPECDTRHPGTANAEQRELCLADCNLCEGSEICVDGSCCPVDRACPGLERCCPEGDRCSLDGECVGRGAEARD